VLISTTEHVLSAFVGMGVDNAIVELDNLELPILDGSALPIVEMVQQAGLRKQKRLRQYLRVLKPVEVREGVKFIGLYPAENFSVCYSINFPHPLIGEESICSIYRAATMRATSLPARTFGFLHEAEALRNMGLIRGASEENAIVLTRDGIRTGPLRFPDEFVRHKVLDLIGDLSLIGHQVLGRVQAVLAGHAMHTALVRRLLRDTSSWELATLEEPVAMTETVSV